jgi:hypothetical protein
MAAAHARLGRAPEAGPAAAPLARLLLAGLLKCGAPNAVEFSVNAPRFVVGVSQRPVAMPLARFQAATGTAVANLRHQAVTLCALDRQVLRHLDGSRDRDQLVQVLAGGAGRGLPGELLDQSLCRLAGHALLAG